MALDSFQTGVMSVGWRKWFTKRSDITVTGPILVHTTAGAVLANTQLPSLPETHAVVHTHTRAHTHTHTHTHTHGISHSMLCF